MTSYAYGVVSVSEAGDIAVSDQSAINESRPFTVELGGPVSSVLHLSREAAEALVDGLVAVLVVGGDPDAAPF